MMNFLVDNQETFYAIGLTLFVIFVGVFIIPKLKERKWLTQEGIDNAQHALELYDILISILKLNDKTKEESYLIYIISKTALTYTENMMNVTDEEEKKKIVREVIIKALTNSSITLNEEKLKLIDKAIDYAVNKTKEQ